MPVNEGQSLFRPDLNNLNLSQGELRKLGSSQVLITGSSGFVGSHLARRIRDLAPDALIVGLDTVEPNMQDDALDIMLVSSTENVEHEWRRRVSAAAGPSLTFHLGEYSRIVTSFEDFDTVWKSNVVGTKAVLSFTTECDSRLVYAASSSRYGDNGGEMAAPYNWTKARNVSLLEGYERWFGLDHVVVYFSNVYGEGQRSEGKYATVIGLFESAYLKGEPLPVVAPGTQTRDFTYVGDTVDGVILASLRGSGDGYVLATGVPRSILDVAQLFACETVLIPPRKGERGTTIFPSEQSAASLGWKSSVDLADYIHWFRGAAERGMFGGRK